MLALGDYLLHVVIILLCFALVVVFVYVLSPILIFFCGFRPTATEAQTGLPDEVITVIILFLPIGVVILDKIMVRAKVDEKVSEELPATFSGLLFKNPMSLLVGFNSIWIVLWSGIIFHAVNKFDDYRCELWNCGSTDKMIEYGYFFLSCLYLIPEWSGFNNKMFKIEMMGERMEERRASLINEIEKSLEKFFALCFYFNLIVPFLLACFYYDTSDEGKYLGG